MTELNILEQLLGCYFHQDWLEEFDNDISALDAIVNSEPSEYLQACIKEIDGYKPETAESFCRDWLLLVTQTFVCVTSKIWSEIAKKQSHYPSPRQCNVNGFH
jgi:hypothetical protein